MTFQFIDGPPSASPDVRLDLDDSLPFFIKDGASISPPKLRRSVVQGIGDGSVETGSSYEDRVIRLPLGVKKVSGEEQSTAIQTLVRILNEPWGAWLKVQADGMDHPRFFRTRRADVDVIDDIYDARPDRSLMLELTAEPFAYGLPETGQFTITNNPAAPVEDNPMMYAFGEILGDVMTPLHLTFPITYGGHRIVWASQAAFDGTVLTAPYYKSLSEATIKATPPASWTNVDQADATMVAGTRRRVQHTSAADPDFFIPTQSVMLYWFDLPVGDYRVMARLAGINEGMKFYFWNKPPSAGLALLESEVAATYQAFTDDPTGHDWIDLGVVAMPGGAPQSDTVYGLDTDIGPATWNFGHHTSVSGQAVDYDVIMLIPAGRPQTLTRHGSAVFPLTYLDTVVTLDGVSNRRYGVGRWATLFPASVSNPSLVSGALPVVVPGAANTLTFVATASLDSDDVDDDKALTTTIDFKYFPRYLYDRPALT